MLHCYVLMSVESAGKSLPKHIDTSEPAWESYYQDPFTDCCTGINRDFSVFDQLCVKSNA